MDSIILVDIFEKSNHPFIYQTSEHHIPPRHRDLLSSFKSRKGFQGAPSMRGALEHMGAHGTRTCMKWYENDSRLWPLICLLISNFQVVKSDSESNCIEFLVAVKKCCTKPCFFFQIKIWSSNFEPRMVPSPLACSWPSLMPAPASPRVGIPTEWGGSMFSYT